MINNLPKWIIDIVSSARCTVCNTKIKRDNITAIGVRESSIKKNKETIFVMCNCEKCKNKLSIDVETSCLEDFCIMIINELATNKIIESVEDLDLDNENLDFDEFIEYFDDDEDPDLRYLSEEFNKRDNKKDNKDSKKNGKSKITQKEIDDIKEFLSKTDKKDILRGFGIIDMEGDNSDKV